MVRSEDQVASKPEEQEGDEPAEEAEPFAMPDRVARAVTVVARGRVSFSVVPVAVSVRRRRVVAL